MAEKYLYGGPDDEVLTYTHPDEYIKAFLDEAHPDYPETIEVVKYQPMKPSIGALDDHVLEYVLEALDEEYGNPDGGWPDATQKMRELAREFVQGVIDEYDPWAHEPVGGETVNVAEWLAKRGGDND